MIRIPFLLILTAAMAGCGQATKPTPPAQAPAPPSPALREDQAPVKPKRLATSDQFIPAGQFRMDPEQWEEPIEPSVGDILFEKDNYRLTYRGAAIQAGFVTVRFREENTSKTKIGFDTDLFSTLRMRDEYGNLYACTRMRGARNLYPETSSDSSVVSQPVIGAARVVFCRMAIARREGFKPLVLKVPRETWEQR
jgi:hypothetical protein